LREEITAAPPSGEVTMLLGRLRNGEREAVDQLFSLVYNDLKDKARDLNWGRSSTTSLVNEVYLRMVGATGLSLRDRYHFYNYAAEAIRRVLVDRHRAEKSKKRGGGHRRIDVDPNEIAIEQIDWIALDEALNKLKAEHERQHSVVMLQFFGGWEQKDIAESLGTDPKTVSRDWLAARAFLLKEMDDSRDAQG
jgi:RNA polymerase sigma factor (TIGR02999 family)